MRMALGTGCSQGYVVATRKVTSALLPGDRRETISRDPGSRLPSPAFNQERFSLSCFTWQVPMIDIIYTGDSLIKEDSKPLISMICKVYSGSRIQ